MGPIRMSFPVSCHFQSANSARTLAASSRSCNQLRLHSGTRLAPPLRTWQQTNNKPSSSLPFLPPHYLTELPFTTAGTRNSTISSFMAEKSGTHRSEGLGGKDSSAFLGTAAVVMVPVMVGSMMAVQQQERWGGVANTLDWTWPDWEKESYPAAKDLLMIPMFAVLFPSVRFLFDNLLLERFGKKVIRGVQQPFIDVVSNDMDDYQRRKLTKFKESAWKGLYYLTAELFALAVTYNEPWFTESKQFWVGPGDQRWPNQMTRLKLKVLYGFAGGFYTYSIFALIFWETKRKDFGVSMSHHVAAVVLIIFSYLSRFARVGSVVLAIHDASDVILELAKLSKYMGSEVCASVAFVLFVLSWVLLRLIYFPSFVIWSTSYEVLQLLDRETNPHGPVLYYIFNTLLISLFILHIYWWVLMWRMIVKQVQDWGKISDDIRSDSEDEEEKEDTTKED